MSNDTPHTHSEHPHYLAHHFKSMDQQTASGKLGMWIFMGQEILFFSGLFCAYGYVRFMYPDMVVEAQKFMDWRLGGINSIVLLISSLTMSLCVRSARLNKRNDSIKFLLLTMLCGLIFLVIKGYEWGSHFHEGLYPGKYFDPHPEVEITSHMAHVFFGLYYVITGMHGLHIVVGLGLMIWLLIRSYKGEFNSENYISLENTSLFLAPCRYCMDLFISFALPCKIKLGKMDMPFNFKNVFVKSSLDVSSNNNEVKHQLLPVKVYIKTFFILLFLIFVNIGISKLPIPQEWITFLLISISTVQSILVGLFFMELIHEDKFYSFAFCSAVLFMILFFVITLLELNGRGGFDKSEGIKYMRSMDKNGNFAPAGPERKTHSKE